MALCITNVQIQMGTNFVLAANRPHAIGDSCLLVAVAYTAAVVTVSHDHFRCMLLIAAGTAATAVRSQFALSVLSTAQYLNPPLVSLLFVLSACHWKATGVLHWLQLYKLGQT